MATWVSIGRAGAARRGTGRSAASMAIAAWDGLGRLAAWIVAILRHGRGLARRRDEMQLVDSLALGNRRQLLLVVCGGHKYLVGAGADCVGSIVAIEPVALPAEEGRLAAGTPPEAMCSARKGPELVRHRARQIPPEAKPGADRWQ